MNKNCVKFRGKELDVRCISIKTLIMIILSFVLNTPVYADLICKATDGQTNLFDLGVDTPAIKVTPGIPLGTVIFSKTYDVTASCSLNKLTDREEVIYFKRKNITQALGYGLTINIGFNNSSGNKVQSISTGTVIKDYLAVTGGTTSTYWPKSTFSVDVEIVKTSNSTQAGAVSKGIELFSIGGQTSYPVDSATFTMQSPNSVTYTTETCKIKGPASFTVNMGKTTVDKRNGFGSGVGSISKAKDFNISLLCDVDIISAFKIMLQLDGTSPVGGLNSGLLSLSPDAENAKGVALQILLGGSENPVKLGTSWQIGSFPVSGEEITIPFSARYYQTEDNVTPGVANSTMVYTVSYI